MEHYKRIVLVVDLLDLESYLHLVLYGEVARIKEFFKLDNFIENSLFERRNWSDALVLLAPHFFRESLVVEI